MFELFFFSLYFWSRYWTYLSSTFDPLGSFSRTARTHPEKEVGGGRRATVGWQFWIPPTPGSGAVWNHFHLNLLWRLAFEIGCCCRGREKHNIAAEEIVLVLLLLCSTTVTVPSKVCWCRLEEMEGLCEDRHAGSTSQEGKLPFGRRLKIWLRFDNLPGNQANDDAIVGSQIWMSRFCEM